MSSPYEDLIRAITETGISRAEAEHAARRCAMAMAKGGLLGYAGGSIAFGYFMAMNPATAIPYLLVSTAVGGGYALTKSPQCSEVRDAISFWNTAKF
jgi:hypothetical protein